MILIPLILVLLLSLIPSIYVAAQKNFMFIENPKHNYFVIRLLYLTPGITGLLLGYCFFVWAVFIVFFQNFSDSMYEIFGYYSLLPLPLIGDLIILFIIKKYILRKDMPSELQLDFMEHELYIFMPLERKIDDRFSFQNPGHYSTQSIGIQIMDITVDYNEITNQNIIFTKHGEIIVNINTLNALGNLTGYQTRSVLEKKTGTSSNIYFQLVAQPISPLSSKTVFKKGTFPYRFLIKDDKVYYNSSILKEIEDFNRSYEYFGSNDGLPYLQQKLWIVTNKTMKILVNELNQKKRDFIPVHLVDEKDENDTINRERDE